MTLSKLRGMNCQWNKSHESMGICILKDAKDKRSTCNKAKSGVILPHQRTKALWILIEKIRTKLNLIISQIICLLFVSFIWKPLFPMAYRTCIHTAVLALIENQSLTLWAVAVVSYGHRSLTSYKFDCQSLDNVGREKVQDFSPVQLNGNAEWVEKWIIDGFNIINRSNRMSNFN